MNTRSSRAGFARASRWSAVAWTAALLGSFGCRSTSADARPPVCRNVLFLAIDDLRPDLGCYGAAHADTPHMDAFARTATLFERHFVQAPSCGPSRAALLTGRSPAQSGRLANHSLYGGDQPLAQSGASGPQTLPELFRTAGHRTVCIGKISHTPDGRVFGYDGSGDGRDELPGGWDELATPFGPWKRGWGSFFAYSGGRHREDGSSPAALMEFAVERDDELPDGLMAEAAAMKLRELAANGEPFFLGVGFFKPHLPFVAPAGDHRAVEDIELPDVAQPALAASRYGSNSGEFYRYDMPFEKTRPLPTESADEARRAYLACTRYVDRQVGAVLAALESTGLDRTTVVVLWSDHGWHLGESGVWGKHTLLDRSLHSPLLVRAPGVSEPGARVRQIVESVDVLPTVAELCGIDASTMAHGVDGESLASLLGGESEADRAQGEAFAFWRRASTVRTSSYRLIARRKPDDPGWHDVELYYAADGPDPVADVADAHPEVVERLLGQLDAAGEAR